MNEKMSHEAKHDGEQCPECDAHNVCEKQREQGFTYGTGERAVKLTATVPVLECQNCGFTFTDERADKARQIAICRHEHIFTPEEITTARARADMSRSAFATMGRFGAASLARWETGALAQNGANDQLIYLMQFPPVRSVLMARREEETLLPEEVVRERIATAFNASQPRPTQRSDRRIHRKTFRALHEPERYQPIGHAWRLRLVHTVHEDY
jgi:DNA-binding transcriptional regulator YiaG